MGIKHKRKLSENENVDVAPKKIRKQQRELSENVVAKNLQADEHDTADSSSNNGSESDLKQQQQQQQQQPQKVNYRKRKKHFYNSIRNQMEFYFGDANLTKDRFLRQLIDKDPLVPLEVFLTFNKMKQITTSVEDIAKALKNSELLELDDTQLKVKRKTPIPTERNVDEKTLYVESLPPTADHEWLRHIFNRFGKIAYISLPKYIKSRKIKGFAFIEFECEQSVEKAVKTFKKFNSVLCMTEQDPSELCSIKTYIKEQEGPEVMSSTGIKHSNVKEQLENVSEDLFTQGKNKDTEDSSKRQQRPDDASKESASQTDSHLEDTASVNEIATQKQIKNKKKRRKKKKSTAEKIKNAAELNIAIIYNELKILPKIHWKRLRNKYLNMQRQCIKELKAKTYKEKQELKQQQQQQQQQVNRDTDSGSSNIQSKKHKVSKTLENHALQTINMNFYGAGDDNNQTKLEVNKNELENSPLNNCINAPKYEPGLIVEIVLLEPCDAKEFKTEMRQHTSIKYIDAKEGQMTVFIRMESAIAANEFIHKISCAEYQCKILSGDAEKEYWYKIERDRVQKLSKQVKIPQKRSREKIQKLINKHIRFDDEEDEME